MESASESFVKWENALSGTALLKAVGVVVFGELVEGGVTGFAFSLFVGAASTPEAGV